MRFSGVAGLPYTSSALVKLTRDLARSLLVSAGLCWSSVLATGDGPDTGAAHSDEAGLQSEVVAMLRP